MAWDTFTKNGKEITTGDKPMDEMAIALAKIAKAYQDRYDRNPYMRELIHALKIVIKSTPQKYLADPDDDTLDKLSGQP